MKISVINQKNGVKAILKGFNTKEISEKISACQDGACSCDCDPAMMAKITGIELKETEDGAELIVNGAVDADTLAPMMQSCLIGDNEPKC
ncbi:MAG: hypothetical protein QG567_1712 [Campylobacterota bacterium]|nr:hypothetical protein [Campylobacterota bacterium]